MARIYYIYIPVLKYAWTETAGLGALQGLHGLDSSDAVGGAKRYPED